jgi:predicted MFS family arabinose efflux permease
VLGSIAAGVLAAAHGWRAMFAICGGAGFVLVLLMLVTMREPARGRYDAAVLHAGGGASGFGESMMHLLRLPGFALLALGTGIGSMAGAILPVWAPTFLLRSHGVALAEVGALIGPAVGIGGVTGTILSGLLASRLAAKHGSEVHGLIVPLIALPFATPFFLLYCFSPSLLVTMLAAAVMNFLLSSGVGPCIAAAIALSPPSTRAVSSTLMLAATGIIGSALAPLIVGMLSDALTPGYGAEALRYAMASMMIAPPLAALILWFAFRRARLETCIR